VTYVRGEKLQREDVIGRAEFDAMLRRAAENRPHPYYALRDQAVLCILWKTGKRRGEVARLKVSDINLNREAGTLSITFRVEKKRRRLALSQRRTKTILLSDPYAQPIIRYWEHMRTRHPDCIYLFPSTRLTGFGDEKTVTLIPDRHLTGQQIWNIVDRANPMAWPHLFRETVGAKIVRRFGNTLESVFSVKLYLDLERTDTDMRYISRYGEQLAAREPVVEEPSPNPPTSL